MGISNCTHLMTELIDVISGDRRCELCSEVIRKPPRVPSPCCKAHINGALADGILVGSCEKCGKNICRSNPRTSIVEWLDGEPPGTNKKLRPIKEWYPPQAMKVVVGLVGAKGSGKGTFVQTLERLVSGDGRTIQSFRSGDILARILTALGFPLTRENMQNLAVELRKTFGDTIITDAMRKQIAESDADVVIFDGVRWLPDAAMIAEFPKSVLIHIYADPLVRYQRMKTRKEKAGEEMATYEQFMKEEGAATEVEIPKIAEDAHFEFENNSTVQDFEKCVKELFDEQMFVP